MSEFQPLSERTSAELKQLVRTIEGSIKVSLPAPLDADLVWWYIYDELVELAALLKRELAIRWNFCQEQT